MNCQLRPPERATRPASQDVQERMGAVATLGVSGTLNAAESGQWDSLLIPDKTRP